MSMRTAFTGVVLFLTLAACGGKGPAASPSAQVPSGPTGSSGTTGSTGVSLPIPSGGGVCADRAIIDDVINLIHAGDQPFRRVAAFIGATQRILGADALRVQLSLAKFKVRQLVLVLNTLRLGVLGAAENYPGDFSVRQFTDALPDRVAEVSRAVACAT